MSRHVSLKSNAAEKAVTKLATWIYSRKQLKKDSLSAVEKAMDKLSYEGDACLDDIADRVVKNYDEEKNRKKETDNEREDRDLRNAQRRMDELAGVAASTTKPSLTLDRDDDDWDPQPPPVNQAWMQTLEILDTLEDRLTTT